MLASHAGCGAHAGRVSHWLVPAVFIVVGVLILITSGTLTVIGERL